MRLLLFVLSFLKVALSYKYLVYSPLFGHSHCNYLGTIADALTEAGHEVTVVMPVMDRDLMNKTGVKLTQKTILLEGDPEYSEFAHSYVKMMFQDYWTIGDDPSAFFEMTTNLSKLFSRSCDMIMRNQTLLTHLRNENFDVGIAETFYICGFGFFEHLGISKTIAATSMARHVTASWYMGEPLALSASSDGSSAMLSRGINGFFTLLAVKLFDDMFQPEYEVLRRHMGKNASSPGELFAKASIHFTQSNPYLDFPLPMIHKTVPIGGITGNVDKTAKLEDKWNSALSQRTHNVLISFGSVSKSIDMPERYRKTILDVIASLPNITFIWKYEENTNMADNVENLHLIKWAPQTALLAHDRLSAFITHGGLGSTIEVAHSGKPAIMIPIFAEQPMNAAMLSRHGGSIVLERSDLADEAKLRNAILEVVHNLKYAEAAQKLASILTQQPISAKQQLVSHSEFVAKFGPLTQLDPYGRNLSVVSYYLIDVVVLALGVLITVVLYIFCVTRKFIRWSGAQKNKVD